MADASAGPAVGRPTVLIIGPVPPPTFGVAKATELMLDSSVLKARLRLIHLDTSDIGGFAKMGRLSRQNVGLGVRHVARLVWLLAKEHPDVTLLTVSQGRFALLRDMLFVLASRAFGSRVVAYLRGSRYADMRAKEGRLAARALRLILVSSSRVLVLGDGLARMAYDICPESRVAVVHNGCPPAVPVDRVGTRDQSHPILIYMGRLAQAKGLNHALQAAKSVAEVLPELEFVLCGEWDSAAYESELRHLVRDNALSDVVRFPGTTTGTEKEALLARAWVLIVPSLSEGQPWVILEAMSAGIPVVATDTGAIAETVQDGVSGFVVPVGDSKSLADSVTRLLQDGDLWRRMSQESVRRYQELFTVERSHTALADELCRVARGD